MKLIMDLCSGLVVFKLSPRDVRILFCITHSRLRTKSLDGRAIIGNLCRSSVMLDGIKLGLALLFSLVVYYADLAKDIYLAVRFKSKLLGESSLSMEALENNTYPLLILATIIASIILTEVLNFVTEVREVHFESWAIRALAACLAPLLPGAALYLEKRSEFKKVQLCHKSQVINTCDIYYVYTMQRCEDERRLRFISVTAGRQEGR